MRDILPLFEKALKEFAILVPNEVDAARFLVRHYYCEIVEGSQPPFDGVRRFVEGFYATRYEDFIQQLAEFDGFRYLEDLYYEYKDNRNLEEVGAVDREEGVKKGAELDLKTITFATTWMRENCQYYLDPAWLKWNDGTVLRLAQSIDDQRAFDRLPILADALEEAGCTNTDVLDHCRDAVKHVRGCWVVDLILGKE
jgi:hypothetical protein